MTYTWNKLGLSALLATALTTAALAAPEDPRPTDSEKLAQIQKKLDEVRKDLDVLLGAQSENVQAIQKDMSSVKSEINALKGRLERLEKAVDRMSSPAVTRRAGSYTPPQAGTTGTVRLQNTSAVPATIVLNGQAYEVAPNSVVNIASQPAGVFTYEVFADGYGRIRPARAVNLAPGETFTITVTPQ